MAECRLKNLDFKLPVLCVCHRGLSVMAVRELALLPRVPGGGRTGERGCVHVPGLFCFLNSAVPAENLDHKAACFVFATVAC